MLAHLRRVPELVLLHDDRHFTYRYSAEKGPAWLAIEKAGFAASELTGDVDDDDDDSEA